MTTIDFWITVSVLITIAVFVLIGAVGGLAFYMYRKSHRRQNPLDFLVFECFENDVVTASLQRGRQVKDDKGVYYVTAKMWGAPKSINLKLGSKIQSKHLLPSSTVRDGKVGIVAIKDGVPAPLELGDIPRSFNLTPQQTEATDFILQDIKDNALLYKKPADGWQKLAAIGGIVVLLVCVIGVIVIMVLMLTLSPDWAKGASRAVTPPVPAADLPV